MATEKLNINGLSASDPGDFSGSVTDIDEAVGSADGNVMSSSTNGEGEILYVTLSDSAIIDDNVVTAVDMVLRCSAPGSGNNSFDVELMIGGVSQGTANTGQVTGSLANYNLSVAGWDSDWTAAQLDGAEVRITCAQSGKGVNTQYNVDCLDVDIVYSIGTDETLEHYRFTIDSNAPATTGFSHESATDFPFATGSSEDTAWTSAELDTTYNLVVKVLNSGDTGTGSIHQLEFRVDTGAGFGSWTTCNASSTPVQITPGSDDDTASSAVERLSGTTATTYEGTRYEDTAGNASNAIAADVDCEFYYSLQFLSSGLSGGDQIEFRINNTSDTKLVTSTVTPSVTITAGAQTIGPAGGIASGESFATDHVVKVPGIRAAGGIASGEVVPSDAELILPPRVWLNSTQTLSGATEMTVTAYSATSITFSDPTGAPTGSLFLGVENRQLGGGDANTGWIAVTVNDNAQDITIGAGIASGESLASDHSIALSTRQSITAAGGIATGESLASDHSIALSTPQSISAAGGIASGESFATDHSLLATQVIESAGGIATGESLASDHSVALSTPQSITAAGGIASGESFATDHTLSIAAQQISSAGGIASGESLANDHSFVLPPRVWLNTTQTKTGADEMTVTSYNLAGTSITFSDPVGGKTGSLQLGVERRPDGALGWIAVTVNSGSGIQTAGGIASGESFATDHAIALSTPQTIAAAGGIATGESLASDHSLALSTRLSISAAGGIATGESLANNHVLANVVQEIIADSIASSESFATDHNIQIDSPLQTITVAAGIISAEAFETDHTLTQILQTISAAGGILSGEAFENDNQIIELLSGISQAGAIASAEVVTGTPTVGDPVTDNPTPDGLYVHGTGLGLDGQIYAVAVGKTFGGAPTDVFLAGTRHTVSGAMYITFDAPDGSAVWINGILHTTTGIRYCVDAIGSDKWPEGFATDAGNQTITTTIGGFYLRAIRRTIDGRMVIDL